MFGVRRFKRAADKEKHKQLQKNRSSARARDTPSVTHTGKASRVSLATPAASSAALHEHQPAVSAQLMKQQQQIACFYSSKHSWGRSRGHVWGLTLTKMRSVWSRDNAGVDAHWRSFSWCAAGTRPVLKPLSTYERLWHEVELNPFAVTSLWTGISSSLKEDTLRIDKKNPESVKKLWKSKFTEPNRFILHNCMK